jgi:glutamate-1-semialdehyde 2,1-aminomutase
MGLNVRRSKELFEKARTIIPGGVNSDIRGPSWGIFPGVYPMYIKRAKGSRIYDVDGNEYIDYILGYGPIILGHCHPRVIEAVKAQIEEGTVYGLSHENEIKLAQMVIDAVPYAEMVRFTSTGTEANIGAIRIARAYTGKNKIAKFEVSYHGWEDTLLVGVAGGSPINYYKTASPGVSEYALQEVIILPYDLGIVEKIIKRNENDLAAILVEVFGDGWIVPKVGYETFLRELRKIADEYNILLIFDEVKTGFRLAFGGAQERFHVAPDLATFAKALGNGFPIAAITGKREIMEAVADKARLAGTFNANPVSVAAAIATLTELKHGGESLYKRFLNLGAELQKGIKDAITDLHVEAIVQGCETMFRIAFTHLNEINGLEDLRTLNEHPHKKRNEIFGKECVEKGILGHPNHSWFTSMAHTMEDVQKTITAVYESMKKVKDVI